MNAIDKIEQWKNATTRFLAASDRYKQEGEPDGRFIVDTYLRKFQDDEDDDRAQVARDIAAETEKEIDQFWVLSVSLVTRTSMAQMKAEAEVVGAEVRSLGAIMDHANESLKAMAGSLPGGNAVGKIAGAGDGPSMDALDKAIGDLRKGADGVIDQAISITSLAASIVDMRTDTLGTFRQENLDASWQKIKADLIRLAEEIPRDILFDKFRDLVQEMLHEYLKKVPFLGWVLWLFDKIKALSAPKAGTKAGDTDIMLKLLPALRKDGALLAELDRIYSALMAR